MTEAPRVLIVEDEPAWREILGEILVDAGYAVNQATNLGDALRALHHQAYNLVVIDISLSDADHDNRDGLRVLLDIHRRHPGVPTLMISGYSSPEIEVLAESPPNLGLISKSEFERQTFLDIVRKAVGPAIAAGPAPDQQSEEEGPPHPAEMPSAAATDGIPRVLVVEDESSWRDIYRELLDDEGFEPLVAASYGEALGWLRRERFALAIVDLKLVSSASPEHNRDGYRLLRYTHDARIPTIVVSGVGAPEEIDRAYAEYGIVSFIDKGAFDREAFRATVRAAVRSPAPSAARPQEASPEMLLTARERDVLELMALGLTNREIAKRLVTSPNTVKKQVSSILAKLGVSNRAGAVRLAIELGLIHPR